MRRQRDNNDDVDDVLGESLSDYNGTSLSAKAINKFVFSKLKSYGDGKVQDMDEDFIKSVKIELRKKLSDDQIKDFKDIWTNALAYRRIKFSQIAFRKFKKLKKEQE